MKYATRINSFLRFDSNLLNAFQSIGSIEGVDYVDLNYPEHFADYDIEVIKAKMEECGLRCNAINLRFRDKYIGGEFGNHEPAISQDAITLCREAADACRKLGGNQMIIWLGFDGFDYSFQIDYVSYWNRIVKAFRDVCDYSKVPVSIEYKPYEERVHAFIDSFGTAVSVLHDVDRENLGVTLDFCHMLMKRENPAYSLALAARKNKLYGLHMNDGYGELDNGLIFASVSLPQALEFVYYLKKYKYDGVVFFDSFPIREAADQEVSANIQAFMALSDAIDRYGMDRIEDVMKEQDGIKAQRLILDMFSNI